MQKHQGTQYEFLARVEEERVDRAKVAFVEANRYRLKEGNQLTIVGYSQLVTQTPTKQEYLPLFCSTSATSTWSLQKTMHPSTIPKD